jgi:hypothetical protein
VLRCQRLASGVVASGGRRCGVQRKTELGDAERRFDFDAGPAGERDGRPLAALGSGGSEAADRRAREGGERRLALCEGVVTAPS